MEVEYMLMFFFDWVPMVLTESFWELLRLLKLETELWGTELRPKEAMVPLIVGDCLAANELNAAVLVAAYLTCSMCRSIFLL